MPERSRKKSGTKAKPTTARAAKKTTRSTKTTTARKTSSPVPSASRDGSAGKPGVWNLRLYVAGEGQKSRTALRNLQDLCERHLGAGRYHIEIIDLVKDPQLAKVDQILAIPTLVRKIPEPMKRVIGDLSNAERAMLALDLRDITEE